MNAFCRHDGRVGTLVTLDLPADAPAMSMPWIITFGPLSEDEEWEPVVVGPYERPHALALAEEIVADEDLMAVVEPLMPRTSVAEIRADIEAAIALADEQDDDEEYDDEDDLDDDELVAADHHEQGYSGHTPGRHAPTPEEIRAGFERISGRLTGSH